MSQLKFPADHFVIPTGDGYLFYVPLKGRLYSLNLPALEQLCVAIQGERPGSACSPLVAQIYDDLRAAEKQLLDATSPQGPLPWDTVILDLSTDCTLSCRYCYAGTRHPDAQSMSFECATAAINLSISRVLSRPLSADTDRYLRLVFHGGSEPTTNWDLFVGVIEYARNACREHGLQLTVSMSTNGYYSEERAVWITQNLTNLSLSLDGDADVQDAQRPAKNGDGSFDIVYRSAEIFRNSQSNGFVFGLRPTVTDAFVEHLPRIVAFFQEHFPGVSIGVEPVQECGSCRLSRFRTPDPYLFVQKFIEASLQSPDANLTYSAFGGIGTLRQGFCGASRPQFAVLTSGVVTACFGYPLNEALLDEFVFGHYDEKTGTFILDENRMTWLRGLNGLKNTKKCRNCFAKYHCGGDCPALRLAYLNTSNEEDRALMARSERCIISRELTKWALESEVASHDSQDRRKNVRGSVRRHANVC